MKHTYSLIIHTWVYYNQNNLHIESLVEQILDGKQKGFTICTWDMPRQHYLDYEDIE